VVDRHIASTNRATYTMLHASKLKEQFRMRLRAEAKHYGKQTQESLSQRKENHQHSNHFFGKETKLTPDHLKEFGRMSYVTDRKRIKRKEAPRGIQMIMVGYAENHPADCYRMYNPNKDSVVISRDIQWAYNGQNGQDLIRLQH
jgi:hypothetical protein